MKYFLLLLSFLILKNYCFAGKVIEVYQIKSDSTVKAFHLHENKKVVLILKEQINHSYCVSGRVKQIDDSFFVVDSKKVYYSNIVEIAFNAPEKKHIVRKIIGGVLVVPAAISLWAVVGGAYYIFKPVHYTHYLDSSEFGLTVFFFGGLGLSGSSLAMYLDLKFKSHFLLNNGNSIYGQWQLRVIQK